jgi:hypothetical protein
MSRFVTPAPQGARLFSAPTTRDNIADYATRVAQYVPTEIVAFYLAGLAVINSTVNASSTQQQVDMAILYFGAWVLTPIYLWLLGRGKSPKVVHIIVASLAFPIWAYSIGGFLTAIGWYQAFLAWLLLAVFTLVSGAIIPREGQP